MMMMPSNKTDAERTLLDVREGTNVEQSVGRSTHVHGQVYVHASTAL